MKIEFYLLLTYSEKYHLGISAPEMHQVDRLLSSHFYYSPSFWNNDMGFAILGLSRNLIQSKWKLSHWGVSTILTSDVLENKDSDWAPLFGGVHRWLTSSMILPREVARYILSEEFYQTMDGDWKVTELIN